MADNVRKPKSHIASFLVLLNLELSLFVIFIFHYLFSCMCNVERDVVCLDESSHESRLSFRTLTQILHQNFYHFFMFHFFLFVCCVQCDGYSPWELCNEHLHAAQWMNVFGFCSTSYITLLAYSTDILFPLFFSFSCILFKAFSYLSLFGCIGKRSFPIR